MYRNGGVRSMTAMEKILVVNTLINKIIEQGYSKLLLSQIKSYISEANIPNEIYGNMQLKAWLKSYFQQEFYVSDSDELFYIGNERTEARNAKVIEAILTDKLKSGERVLCAQIPSILAQYNGLRYQDFSNGMGMEEWIRLSFPSLDIQDKDLIIKDQNRIEPLTNEYNQMEKIIQMDDFSKGFSWIQKISNKSMAINYTKNIVANSFWRSLIGQKALYFERDNDTIESFAFDTELLSGNGNSIYCIIKSEAVEFSHKWRFVGFCCPQETLPPSSSRWLLKYIGTPRLKLSEIKEQVEVINKQKESTLTAVKNFESQLNMGCTPDKAILEKVSSYFALWDSLTEILTNCGFLEDNSISINQVQEFFKENSYANDICEKIISEFSKVVCFVDSFITEILVVSSDKTTPREDYETFQTLLNQKNDAGGFSELLKIIEYYEALLIAMASSSANGIWESLNLVWNHFSEIPAIPKLIINKSEKDYAPLLGIHSVRNMIETYQEVIEEKDEDKPDVTTNKLKECLFKEGPEFVFLTPLFLHTLFPADNAIREIILSEDNHVAELVDEVKITDDYTPYSIGARLYDVIGNKDQLAEKYFILGLLFDSIQCGKRLLSIYREENDFESFLTIWQYTNGQSYANEEDIVYWMSKLAEQTSNLSDCADEISEVLKRYPRLVDNPIFNTVYSAILSQMTDVSQAYKHWISYTSIVLNEFELAIVDNNIDKLFSMMNDQNGLAKIGYSENEISDIRVHLRNDFTTGLDDYSKGKRLFEIQGNKNCAAEKYFWQSTDKRAKVDLFYIYYNEQDYPSACWIVDKYSINIGIQAGLLKAYSDTLIKIGESSKLAVLAVRFPEIWYYNGVLELLASISSPNDFDWNKINNWSNTHPILEPNPLEKALISVDVDLAKTIIENQDKMAEWGYSEEQQRVISRELTKTSLPDNTKDIVHWTFSLQGNLHRTYESLLLSTIDADYDWALSELYKLYVFEKRSEDVVAYFNAYIQIRNVAENINPYLWSLISLGKNDLLLNYVRDNYIALNQEESLLSRIVEIAEKEGRENEITDLRRKLALTPRNRFEMNLINLNKKVLQEYISTPSSLASLGYDWDEIERIRDAFTKPFIEGADGYAVADRIRKFLGDKRSEPFFLETETDARSAKSLFDIYSKQKRWDDLCDLYRRHDVTTTWNNHYTSNYIKALSFATSKDNCEAYLELLDADLKSSFSESDYVWIYLRTLLGAERFTEAHEYEEKVFGENQKLSLNTLSSFFDFAWIRSNETKDFTLRLINHILKQQKLESFTADEIKVIITANGHLVSDGEDFDALELYLHQNQMDDLVFYLNIYYGLFITNKPDKKEQFYLSLINMIDSFENIQMNITQLLPYFEAYKHLDRQESMYKPYTECLRTRFMSLTKRGELFTGNDLDAMLYVVYSGMFSLEHIVVILEMLFAHMKTVTDSTKRYDLTLFATNMIVSIVNNNDLNNEEDKENSDPVFCKMCNDLAEKWQVLIDTNAIDFSAKDWNTFISFLGVSILGDVYANELAIAWINKAKEETNYSVLLSRILNLVSIKKILLPSEFLCDVLICILNRLKGNNLNEEMDLLISQYVGAVSWDHKQIETILETLKQVPVFDCKITNGTVENLLKEHAPELYYAWIKKEIIFFTDNEERQAKLLPVLLEYVKNRQDDMSYDNEDYQLLYEAVCQNPTYSNLAFLYELYRNSGKTDQATILETLSKDSTSDNTNVIYSWLLSILNERDVDWIERYSKWWQGLIHLTDEDQRTKSAIAYLGLSDEPIPETTLNSLSKLLMSDIYNISYIKCYSRVMRNISVLSDIVSGKLSYLSAVSDPSQLVISIRNCFGCKQYDLGMQLLCRKMEMPISNSSSVGQLLADIYTPDNIKQYGKLSEYLPEVFEWIRKLNTKDPQGEWKNLGRAVDIAIITNSEDLLLEKFQDVLLQQHPGRSAVAISSLIKKHQFVCAKKWLDLALRYNTIDYYVILEDVLTECLHLNILSPANELKLATIPEDGNRRSLEFYGDFVFNAYKMGHRNECISILEYLFDSAKNDKAYFSTLISLCYLKPISSEYLVSLYQRIKAYFVLTQEENVFRVSRMLAILHACINVEGEEKNESVYAFCMRERPNQNGYTDLTDLEQDCQNCIESSDDRDTIVQIIIYTISGHWEIDDNVITILQRNSTVAKRLVSLFPEAFCAACICSVLHNKNNTQYLKRISTILKDFSQNGCAKSISCIGHLSPESIKQLSTYLDIPIEVPGVYYNIIKDIIDKQEEHPNDELFERELTILFSLQAPISYALYANNKYGIRDYVDTKCNDNNRLIVLRVLTQIRSYSLESTGNLDHPGKYLSVQDYLMVINSADRYKSRLTPDQIIRIEIFDTYILLGKLMKGLLSSNEIKQIGLAKYVNMANLLCQNGEAYRDIDTLLAYCPAKWKICVRCMQELVQGCPRNILYVMTKDEFWKKHEGCASFVERMAKDFISPHNTSKKKGSKEKGQALLVEENRKKRREDNWGIIKSNDIQSAPIPYNTHIILFNIMKRNPARISKFQVDIDKYLAEMIMDDGNQDKKAQKQDSDILINTTTEKNEANITNGNSMPEIEPIRSYFSEDKDFRKVEFISDAIEAWRKNRQYESNADDKDQNTDSSHLKIDTIVSEILSNWDSPNDKLRRLCVELGLALFEKYCEGSGLNIIVTDQARVVLYQTASCISKSMDKKALSTAIKTDVELCIESYTDLSQLVEDCIKPALIDLCGLINDFDARKAFVAHIERVRQIGTLLSNPMTPAERLAALEEQIRICRGSKNTLDNSLRLHLIALINKEICSLRDLANVTIEIYNTQGSINEGYLFGRIQNTGNQIVKNVQMELDINGVYYKTYTLAYLEGKTMVPFALKYEVADDEDTLQYSLKAIYEAIDNNKEETREIAGSIKLLDPDENDYNFNAAYQTTRPASKDDYIDRVKIQAEIGRFYSPEAKFNSFPTLAIYGMRRTGKSSVLKKLERMLTENFGEKMLLVETSGEGATAGSLTHSVHSMLVRQVIKNKGDGYASLADYYANNTEWTTFVEKWENAPVASSDFQWIEDFYSELCDKFLQSKQLIVLIDEVDKMNGGYEENPEDNQLDQNASDDNSFEEEAQKGTGDQASQTNLWGILSRITQRNTDPIRFVLCGSDYFTNSMVEGDNLTQFFQKIQRIRVGRMTRNELELALNSLLKNKTDIVFHPDTIPYLWTICGGLPWHSKLIINDAISKKLILENRNVIYPSDVMFSAGDILSSGLISTENNFGVVALRTEERVFVSILAKKAVTMNTFVREDEIYQEFCKIMKDSDNNKSFDRAKKLLLSERQLIVSRDGPEGPQYRFGCELYRLYNRGEKFITQQFQIN